jgi:LemA protein
MMGTSPILIVIILVAVLLCGFVLHSYNRLVGLRNRVRNGWADIDVQLSFRHDLVPNIVETAKGYMAHERGTLEELARAREAAMKSRGDIAAVEGAEKKLSCALGNLLVVAERYPELKASDNFLLLQEQLTTVENRIAFARQHFNEMVRQFNTSQAEFPRNLLATALGFRPEKLFAAEAEDRNAVSIAI